MYMELPNIRWNAELDDFKNCIWEIKDGKERMLGWNEPEECGHSYRVSQTISKDFGDWIASHEEHFKLYLEECWRGRCEIKSITLDDFNYGYDDCCDLDVVYKNIEED